MNGTHRKGKIMVATLRRSWVVLFLMALSVAMTGVLACSSEPETIVKEVEVEKIVEKIVEVEKELSRLRAEIDSLKGRFKFIENSVVTSLVHIYMEEIPNPVSINDPSWNTRDIALDAIKALSSFGQFLVSVIVFIFVFTPVWILIAGLIYGTKKLRNRNK